MTAFGCVPFAIVCPCARCVDMIVSSRSSAAQTPLATASWPIATCRKPGSSPARKRSSTFSSKRLISSISRRRSRSSSSDRPPSARGFLSTLAMWGSFKLTAHEPGRSVAQDRGARCPRSGPTPSWRSRCRTRSSGRVRLRCSARRTPAARGQSSASPRIGAARAPARRRSASSAEGRRRLDPGVPPPRRHEPDPARRRRSTAPASRRPGTGWSNGLPSDWSDLLCEIDLTSSDYLQRAALLLAPVNPAKTPRAAGASASASPGASATAPRRR